MVIFKIDFEKAYDHLDSNSNLLDKVFKKKRFETNGVLGFGVAFERFYFGEKRFRW